ncbi:MAG: mRNA splicing protein [Candelina submexicana]|nr:MAG: mRNA splicing protein [Candelina submexicana]
MPAQQRKPADVSAAAKERNEYIPSFISKKPFYVDDESSTSDYLEHQRLQNRAPDTAAWYDRGRRLGPAATKFRKGACENCGAMTHKTKECLSRPRKTGAKWTGRDIQADEVVQDVQLGWDAKRDRWNGYDATEYKSVVEEYAQMEELRKQTKGSPGQDQKLLEDGDEEGDGAEEAKYEEESDMGRQQSTATRNLRLREDTAKYLLNLDLDSAKYDPKTRSMVDSGATADQAAALVAEDNFMRASGDAAEFEKASKYAWESQERGDKNKQHIQANPTSGEYFRRKEKEESEAKRAAHTKALLEKYGGEKHLQPAPLRDAAITESERYVEYDETGAIKGAPKAVAKSKYPEDVFLNNHTTVWGSWWSDFQWGYGCCHSTIKNSYCTGEEGKQAFEDIKNIKTGAALEDLPARKEIDWSRDQKGDIAQGDITTDIAGKATFDSTPDRLAKKRNLEEMKGGVSDKELEDYKRARSVADDPMAAFLGRDELVH